MSTNNANPTNPTSSSRSGPTSKKAKKSCEVDDGIFAKKISNESEKERKRKRKYDSKISSHFITKKAQIEEAKVGDSCFVELLNLARDGTIIKNVTDSEKSKVVELKKKVQDLNKDVAGITKNQTPDQVKNVHSDIEDCASQIDAFEMVVKVKKT